MPQINIAIDGFSSTGKSTLAKQLAALLGYRYIDSGAMYRAVAYFALEEGLLTDDDLDVPGLISRLEDIRMEFVHNPSLGRSEIHLNGENIESEIRGMRVSSVVSRISAVPEVRRHLVALQKAMGNRKGLVMDGRDIGTVVFPDAGLKVFMTADPGIRAHRRHSELVAKGMDVDLEEVAENLEQRDREDMNRSEGPLRQAPDAVVVDNSHLTPEEQLELVLKMARERITG